MNLMEDRSLIHLPTSFEIMIFKKKKSNDITFVAYNNIYKLIFNFQREIVYFDKELYTIVVQTSDIDIDYMYKYKYMNKFLKLFEKYVFLKIKFKGKGFRIKILKKLKLIKFFFGRSHLTFFKFKRIKIKKINKYKFLLKSLNPLTLKQIASKVTKIKPMNVYTIRGLRLSKQIILKRKGKKSSYI